MDFILELIAPYYTFVFCMTTGFGFLAMCRIAGTIEDRLHDRFLKRERQLNG